jgi:hypothetical protein
MTWGKLTDAKTRIGVLIDSERTGIGVAVGVIGDDGCHEVAP